MIEKNTLKLCLKDLKCTFKSCRTMEDIKNVLELKYCKITNRTDVDFDKKYNYLNIFKSKTIKTFKTKTNDKKQEIFISIIDFNEVPKNLLINVDFEDKKEQKVYSDLYTLNK